MRPLTACLILLLAFHISLAQELPRVYDKENTCEFGECNTPFVPDFDDLPSVTELPNPFAWADERGEISHFSDWKYRRHEISTMIQHFGIGEKPGRPNVVTADYNEADSTLTVDITVKGNTLTLTSTFILPKGDEPFPILIGMGSPSGSLPQDMLADRNIAMIPFNFGQVMQHTQSRGNEPFNELFPDQTSIGSYSAWSWGVSRLIDGLNLVADEVGIDTERIAVSGCSFAGKMALFAGALDERITLTIPVESGGGGITAWRVNETMSNVERVSNTNSAWFHTGLSRFSSSVDKLPFDHHELMAMVAPRALFVTANPGWEWLANESAYVASCAAEMVYDALEIPDRFGYSIVGGHGHCEVPPFLREEMEVFIDKFLLDDDGADTMIRNTIYDTNLDSWIPWETPTLSEGESYMVAISKKWPEHNATNLELPVQLAWEERTLAAEYRVRVWEGVRGGNYIVDEILTDTTITLEQLDDGSTYFWRVQAINDQGEVGPWSIRHSFSTYIKPPGPVNKGDVIHHPLRAEYFTLTWHPVENTSEYRVQFSQDPELKSQVQDRTTSDTSRVMSGTNEGVTYYWRVRGENISGEGPWSDISAYTLILRPLDLQINQIRDNEVSLSWRDVSEVEEGFVIERKHVENDVFVVIDTVEADITSYTDTALDGPGTSYTYRIYAYMDTWQSGYSDEASISLTNAHNPENPVEFTLAQNYPNPFNPATRISFGLPYESHVDLSVYNMLGQHVQTLVSGPMSAGFHDVIFNAENLSSGIYLYTLQTDEGILSRTLSVIK